LVQPRYWDSDSIDKLCGILGLLNNKVEAIIKYNIPTSEFTSNCGASKKHSRVTRVLLLTKIWVVTNSSPSSSNVLLNKLNSIKIRNSCQSSKKSIKSDAGPEYVTYQP
jgi:hypothetical protein